MIRRRVVAWRIGVFVRHRSNRKSARQRPSCGGPGREAIMIHGAGDRPLRLACICAAAENGGEMGISAAASPWLDHLSAWHACQHRQRLLPLAGRAARNQLRPPCRAHGLQLQGRDFAIRDRSAIRARWQPACGSWACGAANASPSCAQPATVSGGGGLPACGAGFSCAGQRPVRSHTPRELEQQLNDSCRRHRGARAVRVPRCRFPSALHRRAPCRAVRSVRRHVGSGSRADWSISVLAPCAPARLPLPFELPQALRLQRRAGARAPAAVAGQPRTRPGRSGAAAVHRWHHGAFPKGALPSVTATWSPTCRSPAHGTSLALRRLPAGEQAAYVCAPPLHHHLRLHRLHAAVPARGRPLRADTRPARSARLDQDAQAAAAPHLPGRQHAVPRCSTTRTSGRVDWSRLLVTVGGGTAVQPEVARRWQERTGCPDLVKATACPRPARR